MTDKSPLNPVDEPTLDQEVELELEQALRAAWSPAPLDPEQNERLIALALEDPLASPSEEELVESERLRRALEGDGDHPQAALARALRVAAMPPAADGAATGRALRRANLVAESAPKRNVVYVTFGAIAATLAVAAAALLLVRPVEREAPALAAPGTALVPSRSTQQLFSEKFETSDTSARVDRIASARERELRSNRYALWGVP